MKNDWGEFIKDLLWNMNKIYFEGLKQGIEISKEPKKEKPTKRKE